MFSKKLTDNRVKNTKRKISKETVDIVKKRDRYCIICLFEQKSESEIEPIEEIHHVYYGLSSNYGPDRNNSDQLVGLGKVHHHKLHFEGGNNYREYCIEYLKQYKE